MKTLTDFRLDVGTDLGDSTNTTFTTADIDRAVEKAVADLSRFLPREKKLELIADLTVDDESFTTPAAASATYFASAVDISSKVSGNTITLAAYVPDIPRPVVWTVTDANSSITALTIILKGFDETGAYIEERFNLVGGLTQTSTNYFKRLTECELDLITGNGASDTISIGTASHIGCYVQLANKPIKKGSVSITGYTEDTDFQIDYSRGRVKLITGTTMAAATAYTIDYSRNLIQFDLATIPDFIRIASVEKVGDVPQSECSVSVFENILTITGVGQSSQAELADNDHISIKYLAKQSPPAIAGPGSYPDFLDSTVAMLAGAYCLFEHSVKRTTQSVADLTSARTAATNAGTAAANAATAIGSASTPLGSASTVLGTATTAHTLLGTALTNVAKYLNNNSAADAAGILAAIDSATLKSTIDTAIDLVKTTLDMVESKSLDLLTYGTADIVETGIGKINAVNQGGEQQTVPESYYRFASIQNDSASARINQAIGYAQQAAQFLALFQAYISQSSGYAAVANGFVSEASARLQEITTYLQQAESYVALADEYIKEAEQYSTQASQSNQQSLRYIESSENERLASDRYNREATARRDEVWTIWKDKGEYIGQTTQTATRQYS